MAMLEEMRKENEVARAAMEAENAEARRQVEEARAALTQQAE